MKKKKAGGDIRPNKVLMDFDPTKFNFNKGTDKQLLFYVNFDNEEVITKEVVISMLCRLSSKVKSFWIGIHRRVLNKARTTHYLSIRSRFAGTIVY